MKPSPRTSSEWRSKRVGFTVYSGAAIALAASLYVLAYRFPIFFVQFTAEDSWAEHATAAAWLVASLSVAGAVLERRSHRKAGFVAFALLAFFVAMEELSWGQRLFGVDPPRVFRNYNTQQQLNLHNFAVSSQYYWMLAEAIFAATVLLPIAARLSSRVDRLCARLGIPLVPVHLWPLFLVPVYLLDYSEAVIAIPEEKELMELTLSLAMAAWGGEILLRPRWGSGGSLWGQVGPTLAAGSAVLVVLVPLMTFGSTPASAGRFEAATRRYPPLGLTDQALVVFRHIEADPRLRSADARLEHALLLLRLDRKEEAHELLSRTLPSESPLQSPAAQNAPSLRLEGHRLALLGQSDRAEQAYTQALELDLDLLGGTKSRRWRSRIHLSLGSSCLALGRPREAEDHFATALALAPDRSARKYVPRDIIEQRARWERLRSALSALETRNGAILRPGHEPDRPGDKPASSK